VFKKRLLGKVFIMKGTCWYYFYFIIPCHRCFLGFTFLKRENQNSCIQTNKVTFMKVKPQLLGEKNIDF
jgi:hypothetical protein